MSETDLVVAIYGTHEDAEHAVKELQRAGMDMSTLSIIGRDTHTEEHVVGYYNNGDRMKAWGKLGGFWGGLWGLMVGSGFFSVPGIGPVLLAGPVLIWIMGALEGAVLLGGLSAIGAGLVGMGIPQNSVIEYETALKTDKYLLMVNGSASDVDKARGVLETTRAVTTAVHSRATVEI